MSQLTHPRRRFPAALSIVVALSAVPALTQAPARATEKQSSVSSSLCDFDWKKNAKQVKRLIRCSARRWKVPGGPDKALDVARCESNFNPAAVNPAGYKGVYQQSVKYWPGRSKKWGFPDWPIKNGRANVMVSIRMAHRYGWGAWGCA